MRKSMVMFVIVPILCVSVPAWGQCGTLADPAGKPPATSGADMSETLVRLRDLPQTWTHKPSDRAVSVSPDGSKIAFFLTQAIPETNSYCSGVFVMDLKSGAKPIQVASGGEAIINTIPNLGLVNYPLGELLPIAVKWSPDGKWLAYLRRDQGVTQIWRTPIGGAAAEPVTISAVDVEDFAWLPGSQSIVFSSRQALLAQTAAMKTEGLSGFRYDDRFQPMASKAPLPHEPLPLSYAAVDLATGRTREASDAEAQAIIARPPPGTSISVASDEGGLAWVEDRANRTGHLFVKSVSGGISKPCQQKECEGRLNGLWWQGRDVVFLRREGWAFSQTTIYRWTPSLNRIHKITTTGDYLAECRVVTDNLLCARETSLRPRHLVFISLKTGRVKIVYDPNPEFQTAPLGTVKRLYWRNRFGLEAFGDLVLPPSHKKGQRHPLIVVQYVTLGFLRGGTGDEYPIQAFANQGFAVLSFNRPETPTERPPSMSTEDYRRTGFNDWLSRQSISDALKVGINLLIAKGLVSADRMGITGLSDGATTVQHVLINDNAFRAAAISSCCTEPTSLLPLGGPALERYFKSRGWPTPTDTGATAWRGLSLVQNATKITTPLLMQLSDDEFIAALSTFSALREKGRTVDMFVYPNEHHIKWQPAHRLSVYRRNLDWFDFWINGKENPDPARASDYRVWRTLRDARN